MTNSSLLLTWSTRRVSNQLKFWWRFLRLFLDWLTIVYLGIPGLAWLGYEGWRYYTGQLTAGLQANTVLAPGLTFSTVLVLSLMLLLVIGHLSVYGYIPMQLETGDLLFLHLSPLRRSRLLATLWLEGCAAFLVPLLMLFALSEPLLQICRVPWWSWLLELLLIFSFENSIRLISQLWNARVQFTWRHWLWYQTTRWLSLIPILIVVGLTLSPFQFVAVAIWLVSVVGITVWTFQSILRQPWDGFYQHRASRIINLAMSLDTDAKATVQYRMRVPSGWAVRQLERIRRRPLPPAMWLILLRVMRRKGSFRDLTLLSSGAIFAARTIPVLWIKLIALGFFVFILYKWWGMTIPPLYEKPISEQFLADPWLLRASTSFYRFWFVTSLAVLWVLIGFA